MKLRLTAATILTLSAVAVQADPSFDCARASHEVETAICGSAALAALDVELSRIYALALNGPNVSADRAQELKEIQRGWVKGRNECWNEVDGINACIAASYALRIDELRTGYADARAGEGASTGPFAYACDGLGALVSAVFVNTDAPLVSLRWRDTAVVLPRVPSASGAKYETDVYQDGTYVFWTQGAEATLDAATGQALNCRQEETG